MILIGQYDSPFVRRVGIALKIYGIPFEHCAWSVFGDADRIRAINPLVRVPTLQLDDGTALTDSSAILDHLDNSVPPALRLYPSEEPARHRAIRVSALALGMAEKAVSLLYERRLHDSVSAVWADRCRSQIVGVLDFLESELEGKFFGAHLFHSDIIVTTAIRFIKDAHTGIVDWSAYPKLSELSARLEATPVFQEISQPFAAPP